MNLVDLLDEDGLQQDEWSLAAPTFGKDSQLTVVGWSGKSNSNKLYILKCHVCSQDRELFGEGYFKSKKCNFVYGDKVPCGCAKSPRLTSEQYGILCQRSAKSFGYNFLGFLETPVTSKSKIEICCSKHGIWKTGTVSSLLNNRAGCPKCGDERASEKRVGAPSPLKVVTNVEDVNQDEWSSSQPVFGEYSQLKVIGWKGRETSRGTLVKTYIAECSVCSNDTELFPEKLFYASKDDFISGSFPCGCAKNHKWTESQWELRCQREAMSKGYKFLGWASEFSGNKTKLHLVCTKHGEWQSTSISNFFFANACPDCGREQRAESAFISTKEKAFGYENNKLKVIEVVRTPRRTTLLCACKSCGDNFKSSFDRVLSGVGCIKCSKHNQTEAYINFVKDGYNTVAIKFGIANDSARRVKQQHAKSVYLVEQVSVYTFPSSESCKRAERECKKELETGVVLKRDMSDGYTETTYVYNLDKIKQIYSKHGGVEVWPSL